MGEADLCSTAGSVAPDVLAELPGLSLRWVATGPPARGDPRELQARLDALSEGYRGASVVAMRTKPVHRAYRACFRQVGLDPDMQRPPAEELALARLLRGGLRARDRLHGALMIALVETGVPVWALDGELTDARSLMIRASRDGDRSGRGAQASELLPGRLVVADARSIHALLFGEVSCGHRAELGSRSVVLFAAGVEGVPAMCLDEALWLAAGALSGD
jgi:DNA/RNA-binding domain of Phe-tRNA-synthetase-like protein